MTNLVDYISDFMRQAGVPAHIKGFYYIRESILINMEQETYIPVTTQLYPAIAKKFETTPQRVERAIRHAIDVVWKRGNTTHINELFGDTIDSKKGKPTNAELIAMISDIIRLQLKNKMYEGKDTFYYHIYCEDNAYGVKGHDEKTPPLIKDRHTAEVFVNYINELGDVYPVHLNCMLEDFLFAINNC